MDARNTGYIYLATAKNLPGLVKIGVTTGRVQKRLEEISAADGMTYEPVYYCKAQNPAGIERRLREEFSFCGSPERRGFFRIDWRALKAVMRLLQKTDGAIIAQMGDDESKLKTVNNNSLIRWIRTDNIENVRRIMDQKGNPNQTDRMYKSALMWAADLGLEHMVKILLEYHADPGRAHQSQNPPLWWAVERGHAKIVQMLLEAGGDPNIENNGITALMRALLAKQKAVANALMKSGADTKGVLMWFVKEGRAESVKIFLECGADANAKDKNGQTALEMARQQQNEEIIKILKDAGAAK